jgi:hypothetical protein
MLADTTEKMLIVANYKVGAFGPEQSANSLGKPQISPERGTESGTIGSETPKTSPPADPELLAVIAAWPALIPAAIQPIRTYAPNCGGSSTRPV